MSVLFSGCDNEAKKEYKSYVNAHMVPADQKRVSLVKSATRLSTTIRAKAIIRNFWKKEIIPEFSNLRLKLNSLDLKTKEVSELNDKFVKVIVGYVKQYEYDALWLEPGADPGLKIKVSSALADVEQVLNSFIRENRRLKKQFGVAEKEE